MLSFLAILVSLIRHGYLKRMQDPVFTGSGIPAQVSRIEMHKSGEPDLSFLVLMGSNSRDQDLSNSGCLNLGPHEGDKATPTRSHPDFHVLLKERQRWLIGK